MFLADTGTDILSFPWDKLSLTVALAVAIVVIWKLNGKLAARNDTLHKELISFHERRAGEAAQVATNYEKIVGQNTEAIKALSEQQKSSNLLLERLLNELDRQNR